MPLAMSNRVSSEAREVGSALLALGAVKIDVNSPFTWVSGIKSPIYCDNRKIPSDVAVRKEMVKFFRNLIEERFPGVEVIAGVATGGIPLGILVADSMGLPFIYVRQAPKEHGLKKQVEGDFKPGAKVVLIEDHISTGGSSLKAIRGLRNEGLELLALISIMTYNFKAAQELFESEDVNYLSLCDLDNVVEVALETGKITEAEKNSVLTFRDDPQSWLK